MKLDGGFTSSALTELEHSRLILSQYEVAELKRLTQRQAVRTGLALTGWKIIKGWRSTSGSDVEMICRIWRSSMIIKSFGFRIGN